MYQYLQKFEIFENGKKQIWLHSELQAHILGVLLNNMVVA